MCEIMVQVRGLRVSKLAGERVAKSGNSIEPVALVVDGFSMWLLQPLGPSTCTYAVIFP